LIDVGKLEAEGWSADRVGSTPLTDSKEEEVKKLAQSLKRFVGTLCQIRERAPRTLEAVETVPRAQAEKWQNRVLKGIGWKSGDPNQKLKQRLAMRSRKESMAMADGTYLAMRPALDPTGPEGGQHLFESDGPGFAEPASSDGEDKK